MPPSLLLRLPNTLCGVQACIRLQTWFKMQAWTKLQGQQRALRAIAAFWAVAALLLLLWRANIVPGQPGDAGRPLSPSLPTALHVSSIAGTPLKSWAAA